MGRKQKNIFLEALGKYRFTNYEIQQLFGSNWMVDSNATRSGLFYYDEEDGFYHLSDKAVEEVWRKFPIMSELFNTRIDTAQGKKPIFTEKDVFTFFAIAGGLHEYIKKDSTELLAIDKFGATYNRESLENHIRKVDFSNDWISATTPVANEISGYETGICHLEQISEASIKHLFSGILDVTGEKFHPADSLQKYYQQKSSEIEIQKERSSELRFV